MGIRKVRIRPYPVLLAIKNTLSAYFLLHHYSRDDEFDANVWRSYEGKRPIIL
jgi:hypothetical protein